jgi:hypothetical protein
MSDDRQVDINDVLQEIRDAPHAVGGHKQRIAFCLKQWSVKGLSLATCADSKHLNLGDKTVQAYARRLKLRFSDYVPYELRTEDERKRGPRK